MGLHKGETVVLSGSFLGYELALKKRGVINWPVAVHKSSRGGNALTFIILYHNNFKDMHGRSLDEDTGDNN